MREMRAKALAALTVAVCAFCFLVLTAFSIAAAGDKAPIDPNQAACIKWCKNITICKCSTEKGCGKSGEVIRSFRGKGQNWNACRYESDIQAWNKKDCDSYCARKPKVCVSCQDAKGCGPGMVRMKTFRFGNRTHLDYYACKKK